MPVRQKERATLAADDTAFFRLININTGSLTDINAGRKNEEEVEMVLERQMML